jgi:UDP-3-O-[3-hydroxymyristoyl] glucosamine N-acyltransferase
VWVRGFTPERLAQLEQGRPALAVCDAETAARTSVPAVVCENPRLAFIRVLNEFFSPPRAVGVHPTAIVAPGAVVGRGASIGAYARIGPQAVLGDDCTIGSGVAIEAQVTLGDRCVVKPNSVLGGQGFGFEYDQAGAPVHFPHLGRIVLEDDVWIGACSTIELAGLGTTRLGRGVKVDDLVQIGHNVTVGCGTLIMAGAVLCGGVVVGQQCWIAPGSIVKQKVRIGNRVTVGLGAVVLKDVADGLVVAGVPAKPLVKG